MKAFHKKVVLWAILVIIAAILLSGLCLFWPVIRSAASVRNLEDGLYSMEYSGDYGLDNFLERRRMICGALFIQCYAFLLCLSITYKYFIFGRSGLIIVSEEGLLWQIIH